MHNISKKLGGLMLGVLAIGGQALTSCSEKIDDSNLYTFTGETVADYLKNNPEFSKFDSIVDQAGLTDLLSAYGTYTCFAPTNEAVTEYLDSLYNDTTVQYSNPHNGMSAPGLAGLLDPANKEKGDSLCKDIAEYHLTSSEVNGIDMGNGVTITTVLGRDLSTTTDSVSGKVCINNYSLITQMDIEKENGVVHVINHVLRRSNNLVGGELENLGGYTYWVRALKETGLIDSLNATKREDLGEQVEQKDDKAYSWKLEDGCKEGFTIFAESDKVFQRNGIKSFEDLVEHANRWYANAATWYPYLNKIGKTVSTGNDYTNPWNALNMFVRYHILPYSVSRDRLTYSYNELTSAKLYEYNRTLLPNTLMKVSFEKDDHGYIINRGVQNSCLTSKAASLTVDESIQSVSVYGVKIKTEESVNPLNGWIHPLEDILVYDEDVPNKVLKERLRFDDTSLFDEMMSNNFRGATKADLVTFTKTTGKSRIIFPTDFFGNIKTYNGTLTVMKYLVKNETDKGYDNYQGDEFLCEGPYDFAIKLPSVPLDGQYEIRIGYTAELARGMLQFYLGTSSDRNTMQPLDIPLDMRIAPAKGTVFNTTTGWADYTKELDNGVATDQAMRNLGYMRGIRYYTKKDGSVSGRELGNCLRRIIYRGNLEQGEHWLRFKTVLPDMTNAQFHLDYIELVPQSVYNNAQYSEDIF